MRWDPEELIREAINRYGDKIAVACSFGKDSIVILHMALKYKPDIKVVFGNTGVEFPETIEYKEQIRKLWNLNLIETKPYKDMTFWKCADKFGLPYTRGKGKGSHTPRCCYYLKEQAAVMSYRENGIQAVLTGLMKSESHNRALLITRMDNKMDPSEEFGTCGQRYFCKRWGVWKLHPIAYWSDKDVWDYIKNNNIPVNPVYTKWGGIYKRCGCLPCTAYISWESKLSISHPALYKMLKGRLENEDPLKP